MTFTKSYIKITHTFLGPVQKHSLRYLAPLMMLIIFQYRFSYSPYT